MDEKIREENIKIKKKAQKGIKKNKTIIERPYKYSIWVTNVSLALLGFYIAFLLQIKSISILPYKFFVIVTLIIVLIPIIIGIFHRFKYELIDIYNSFKSYFAFTKDFVEAVEKSNLNIVDTNTLEDKLEKLDKIDAEFDFIKKWSNKFIYKDIIIQFVFFILGLICVIVYLFDFLFR